MTLSEIKSRLESSGLPVCYYAWPENEAPALPWLVYFESGANGFAADGRVYYSARQISVELYTKTKDPSTESLVEAALAGIVYTKTETYLSDEQVYETIYTMEV